jgi:hypothetical protein
MKSLFRDLPLGGEPVNLPWKSIDDQSGGLDPAMK